jgi:hypothetical protein
MKPRHLILGLALVVTVALVVMSERTPDDGVSQPIVRAAASAPAAAPAAPRTAQKGAVEPAIARLVPRAELVGEPGEAMGEGDMVFQTQDWNPPPQPAPPPPPPPPPSAPPLPFTYVGKAVQDGKWEVFLAQGEKTHIVRANMVIDGIYRVDAIAPPVLTLTYLPLKQVQQLNIGVFD